MYKRILVATDGTSLSSKAVDSAIGLAQSLKAELFALKVVHLRAEDHWDGALLNERNAHAQMMERASQSAQAVVDAVKSTAGAAGVQATALTVKALSVADAVIDAAKTNKCDVIVMASHGRSGLTQVLLGSETLHVLTRSHIPVLVLR